MSNRQFFVAALLALEACSPSKFEAKSKIGSCWEHVSKESGHMLLNDVDFVYLRGRTIIIPSFECENLRIQAVDFSRSGMRDIDRIDAESLEGVVGLRGSILFDIRRQHVRHVIEIDVLKLQSYVYLNERRSTMIMNRIQLNQVPSRRSAPLNSIT